MQQDIASPDTSCGLLDFFEGDMPVILGSKPANAPLNVCSSLLRQHMHSRITVLKVKPFPMSLLT
jgi:hypothetical protein